MLVHSYLYYEKDVNIISDAVWSKWAKELAELQEKYPKESAEVEFADQFKDWDGNSGADLVYTEAIKQTAERLYSLKDKKYVSIEKKQPIAIRQSPKAKIKSATKSLF
jgi:hypothetical protein